MGSYLSQDGEALGGVLRRASAPRKLLVDDVPNKEWRRCSPLWFAAAGGWRSIRGFSGTGAAGSRDFRRASGAVSAALRAAVAAGQFATHDGGPSGATTAGRGASGAAGEGTGGSGSGVPAAIRAAPATAAGLAAQGGGGSGVGGGGSERDVPVPIRALPTAEGLVVQGGAARGAGDNDGKPRRPKTCVECGHCTSAKAFVADQASPNAKSRGDRCQVSQDRQRPDSEREGRKIAGGNIKQFKPCECRECKPKFDAFNAALAAFNAREPRSSANM